MSGKYGRIVIATPCTGDKESHPRSVRLKTNRKEVEQEEPAQLIEVSSKGLQSLCRTCLSKTASTPIDGTVITTGEKVLFLLELCLALKVDQKDGLPRNICRKCVSEIERIYTFRKQCHLNESTLKLILHSSSGEEEEVLGMEHEDNDVQTTYLGERSSTRWDHNYGKKILIEYGDDNGEDNEQEAVESFIIQTEEDGEDQMTAGDEVKGETETREPYIKQELEEVEEDEQDNADNNTDLELTEELTSQDEDAKDDTTQKQVSCGDCDLVFNSRQDLWRHRREAQHPKEANYMCEVCSKMTNSKYKLKSHMRTHTNERPYKCPHCPQAFTLGGNLKRHLRTHTGEKPHICEFCGKGFAQTASLLLHIQKIHENNEELDIKEEKEVEEASATEERVFGCEVCGRIFKTLKRFQVHAKTHDPSYDENEDAKKNRAEPQFFCEVCFKGFTDKYKLRAHMVTHMEKNYQCDQCGKAFHKKSTYEVHLKFHSGERLFKCEFCPKVFPYLSALSFHRVTHTGYKSHKCKICQKTFTQSAGLRSHMRIHTGETPYHCKECPKRFKQQSQLMYHLRVHSGEKPYACPYCGKAFALNGNLTVHIRTHTGETPYKCPICSKGFYDASSRKKHCQTQHGVIIKCGEIENTKDSDDGNISSYVYEEVKDSEVYTEEVNDDQMEVEEATDAIMELKEEMAQTQAAIMLEQGSRQLEVQEDGSVVVLGGEYHEGGEIYMNNATEEELQQASSYLAKDGEEQFIYEEVEDSVEF